MAGYLNGLICDKHAVTIFYFIYAEKLLVKLKQLKKIKTVVICCEKTVLPLTRSAAN